MLSLFFLPVILCAPCHRPTYHPLLPPCVQSHTTAFVEPISVEFAGARVYEVPPNGQGIAVLLALNILKELGVVDGTNPNPSVAVGGTNASVSEAPGVGTSDGGLCKGVETGAGEGQAAYLHRLIEVLRLAFADTCWYCADQGKVDVPVEELLGRAYAAERARLFDPLR